MEVNERGRPPPPASVSVDVDSDEAIARHLHELELERAMHFGHRRDSLSIPSIRFFCLSRRTLDWAYFVYLLVEVAVVIPVLVLSVKERYGCENSNLRVWIMFWESRILAALPLVVIKLCTPRRSFTFEFANAMLTIYILVLFFWGNLLLFSPDASGCYSKSPVSLAFVIAALSVVYAYIAVPIAGIVLVCFCLPVYLIACKLSTRSEDQNSDAIDLAGLQTRRFTKDTNTEGDNPKCAICLNDFVPDQSTVTTLPCGHEFDHECIEYWLSIKNQCAICRQDIGLRAHLNNHGQGQSL